MLTDFSKVPKSKPQLKEVVEILYTNMREEFNIEEKGKSTKTVRNLGFRCPTPNFNNDYDETSFPPKSGCTIILIHFNSFVAMEKNCRNLCTMKTHT